MAPAGHAGVQGLFGGGGGRVKKPFLLSVFSFLLTLQCFLIKVSAPHRRNLDHPGASSQPPTRPNRSISSLCGSAISANAFVVPAESRCRSVCFHFCAAENSADRALESNDRFTGL